MLDFARSDGSQADIDNCKRGLELYHETYSQLITEAHNPMSSSCLLPPQLQPDEYATFLRDPIANHGTIEQVAPI
jgi:hypothetical protein